MLASPDQVTASPPGIPNLPTPRLRRDVRSLRVAAARLRDTGDTATATLLDAVADATLSAYDPATLAGHLERTRWSPALLAATAIARQVLGQ
jgi:hypothetical protein